MSQVNDARVQRYGRAIAYAIDEDYMEDWKHYDRQARAVLDVMAEEAAEAVREPDLLPGLRRALELSDWVVSEGFIRAEIARLEAKT